ncbi:MAG: chromate transporter [Acholeplasmataceae bacterium]|jgi:chromate transporter|nr:chromate transporter [Acholeplasmataceae bacterium]
MIEIMFLFFYIGLFTIGGGMVAIPLIQQQIVERGLITEEFFHVIIAIAESTPGPIGINVATYVGYELYGIIGAILTTTSFILPSFLIVSLLAKIIIKYRNSLLVVFWFLYLKAAVIGLILYATVNIGLKVYIPNGIESFDLKVLGLTVVLALLFYLFRKKPIIVIIFGAILGMLFL